MDESNVDYEGTSAWKPNSDCSDQKRTSGFIWWDPDYNWQRSQQVNQIHSRGHRSVWVPYQAGIAWRHLIFFIQDKEGIIFITGREGQAERPWCKAFEEIQASTLTLVLHMRKISSWFKWWTHKTTVGLFFPHKIKTKHPVHIMVFGVVTKDGDVMHPLIFPQGLKLNTEAYIKCLEEVVLLWIERVTAGEPYMWQWDSEPCDKSRRTQCWLWENFCYHIPLNIWPPNFPDWNPFSLLFAQCGWAIDQQNSQQHWK